MNDNGYKVCYREKGRKRWIQHWVCNTYNSAEWTMNMCKREPQRAKDEHLLIKPAWKIIPLTLKEVLAIRKDCPFYFPSRKAEEAYEAKNKKAS